MAHTLRRPMFNGLTAVGGVGALVCGLAIVDERVRDQIARLVAGRGPTEEIATASERLQDLLLIVLQAIRDQSIEHAPLVIFSLAAAVLVLFMLRT